MTRIVADLGEFFETLTEMVKPFMAHTRLKGHNLNGCRVLPLRKQGHIEFAFLAKGGKEIQVDIHLPSMHADPETYINNMVEVINDAWIVSRKQDRFVLHNKPSRELRRKPLADIIQLRP